MSDDADDRSGAERRSGVDRRTDPPGLPADHPGHRGRPVYSRGPIIVTLIILFLLTSLGSATAVYLAIHALSGRLNTIQTAREKSAFDTCAIIGTVIARTESNGRTYIVRSQPGLGKGQVVGYLTLPSNHAATEKLLRGAKLTDCHRYSVLVRTGKIEPFKTTAHQQPHR